MNSIDILLTLEEATVIKDVLKGRNEYVKEAYRESVPGREVFCNNLADKIDVEMLNTLTKAAQDK